jgi:hypothetical protein
MLALYLLQAIVPPILIAWLAFAPPRNWAGFSVQPLAIGIALFVITMTGIWAFPPWWAIYVFVGLLVASVIITFIKHRPKTVWPTALFGWLSLVGFSAFGLFFANEARLAFIATRLPTQATLALASPLGPGTYLVANGGAGTSVNAHAELLDQSIARHKPYWGTAHGVDLIALDSWGLRASRLMPADPKSYVIFGRPVIAPCAGEVVTAVDGLPDLQVPQMDHDHLAGNHVILSCAGADILLGHFHTGSVRVRVGQKLKVGDFIAQVGNSGNTSEPHLHINAMRPGTAMAPSSGAPIPILINGQYLVRNDRFVVQESPGQP